MNRAATFLFALSILCSTEGFSQYFQYTNFREGSGLPSSESYQVFQDKKGFMWIGTDNGVVKYDGHEFATYNITQGLTDNTVFGFYEDYLHRIWFRTYNGALSYYENDSITTYKYNSELKSIISSSILMNIYPDSLGGLYFSSTLHASSGHIDSTGNASLMSKNHDYGTFIRFVGDKILLGSSGMPRNIKSIEINDNKFDIELDDPLRQSNSLLSCVKWRGKIYFTLHKNMFVYDGKSVTKVFTSKMPIVCAYVDKSNNLWIGYFNDGVEIFSDASLTKSFKLESLTDLSVSSILQDNEDGMWLSTLDQGVFYFPNLTVQNYSPPNSTKVSAVAYADDEVFLGNYDGEVFGINGKGKIRTVHKGTPPINHLFIDRKKQLWVSDGTGSYILPSRVRAGSGGNSSTGFKGMITAGDHIMAYNSMGIFKLAITGEVLEKLEARKRPTAMVIAGDEIFLGGLNGLEIYSLDFSRTSVKVSEARISALISPEERFVMIGTSGQGLHTYDRKTGVLSYVSVADANNVYSIISDWTDRRVWIGTEKGLFQLDFREDPSGLVPVRITRAAGLISTKINTVCRVGNNIWAISDLGISSVPLEHFTERDFVPGFYISRILFRNQQITGNVPVVQTQEGNMVIDVRAITFKGHPVAFRYRLNQNQPWNPVPAGSIFITGLRPNVYNLEIQASAGSQDWTASIKLEIDVLAQWWETWTFRLSVIVSVLLLGYVGYWLRINAIRRRQKYLELINLHQQKLIDSEIRTQERERKRIATDLHDGIGASLSSIKIQVADAMREDEKLVTRSKEINENLTDVIDDIKRIVYDLHPPGLERYGLQAGLKSLVDRLNKAGDINVIFDYYGKREVVQPVSITIFRILQELINNTMKHARASEIRIHINEFDDEINIMYEDNGIGMVGSRFTGLGMHSIESRVRSLDGRMSWESNHKGTFYNFDIPF